MLKIYRCISSNRITQKWSESKACVQVLPNRQMGRVISKRKGICPIGYTDFYKYIGMLYHNGIDLAAYYAENVYHSANFEGWMRTEKDFAGGIGVDIVSYEPILKCTEPNCNEIHYIKLRLWHNSNIIWLNKILEVSYTVKKYLGIKVKMGDRVALAGSTGKSSGVHIHKGIKWCDKDGNGLHTNNGVYGAFDPTPYYENRFVLNIIGNKQKLNIIQIIRHFLFSLQGFIIKI